MANEANNLNLQVGVVNNLDQLSSLESSFDFVVNTACFQYKECDNLKSFSDKG